MRKIVYSLAVGSLAAGCAASHAAPAPPHGTVTGRGPHGAVTGRAPLGTVSGRAQLEGGPTAPIAPPGTAGRRGAQPRLRPLPGTVEFELAGRTHRLVTATAGRSGTFSARLAPGTYHVDVRSPHIREELSDGSFREQPCAPPRTVTVVARRTATITLTCIVP